MIEWKECHRYYDKDRSEFSRILIIGRPGAGKTHFIGTAPKPYVLDCDKGGKTLSKQHIPFIEFERESYDPITKKSKIFPIYETILEILRAYRDNLDPFDKGELSECRTLALDSWSALNNHLIVEAMLTVKFYEKDGKLKPFLNPDNEKPEWDHYSAVLRRSQTIVKILQDISLKSHVIVTVGIAEKDIKTYVNGREESYIKQQLAIEGSFRSQIAHFFDEVWYLENRGGKRYLHTTEWKGFNCKTKIEGLGEVVENPTFDKIFNERNL